MSNIVNKVKDAVSSDKHSAPEGTHGPHSSRVANTVDPRVDSDLDHRAAPRTGLTGSSTATHTSSGGLGNTTHGTHSNFSSGVTHSSGAPEGTYGPHSSRLANAADPRVDSDMDRSGIHGQHNLGSSTLGGKTNTGIGGASHGSNIPEGTFGPHSSRLANAADPRVDSDLDSHKNQGQHNLGSSTLGGNTMHTGTTGQGAHGVGSGVTGTTGTHGAPTGSLGQTPGPAPNTAGPHKSDILNKLDPRVDSDLDGSKTVGGNKTFQ